MQHSVDRKTLDLYFGEMVQIKEKPSLFAFEYRTKVKSTSGLYLNLIYEARTLASNSLFYRPLGARTDNPIHFEVGPDGKRITHWFLQDKFLRHLELQLDVKLAEVEEMDRPDMNGMPMPSLKFEFINTYTLSRFLYACLCFDQDSHPASPYFNGAKVMVN